MEMLLSENGAGSATVMGVAEVGHGSGSYVELLFGVEICCSGMQRRRRGMVYHIRRSLLYV